MTVQRVVDRQSGLPVSNPTESYWHKEPSEKLQGHRTTPELPKTADIAIIGSGITGTFAAHFLKNGKARDSNVVMLEAREACWGATGRVSSFCSVALQGDYSLWRCNGCSMIRLSDGDFYQNKTERGPLPAVPLYRRARSGEIRVTDLRIYQEVHPGE